jgi:hypothetical protein
MLLDECIQGGEIQETNLKEVQKQAQVQIACIKVEMLEEIGLGE